MARNIIATLSIGEGDPPGVILDLRADGRRLLSQPHHLEPSDTLTLADTLAEITGETDVRDVMRGLLEPVAAQLEQQVQQGAERQQRTEQALAAFREALDSKT
jgi:predicted ArsR family transcriptional regulator